MKKGKVAIQGISGAFHEIAAKEFFGEDVETIQCLNFKEVFNKVVKGDAMYAVVAIENTIAGSLLPNYSLIANSRLRVVGEVILHIKQNLLVLPGTKIEDIREVYSHPIAILQTKEFFDDYPNIKLIEWNDTASSAKKIANENLRNAGAIAGTEAGELYGLESLFKGIETNKKNYTRFLVLRKQPIESESNNKASICFELGHYPGALAAILVALSENNINLTKIQSLPIMNKPYEYSFHIDLEWNKRAEFENALKTMILKTSNLSVLGEYQKSEMFSKIIE